MSNSIVKEKYCQIWFAKGPSTKIRGILSHPEVGQHPQLTEAILNWLSLSFVGNFFERVVHRKNENLNLSPSR